MMTVSVCLSVCPRAYLRNYASDIHQIFVHVTYVRSSVLLWLLNMYDNMFSLQ